MTTSDKRKKTATAAHAHRFVMYPADARFEFCRCGERRYAARREEFTIHRKFADREHVRIRADVAASYPEPYRSWEGVIDGDPKYADGIARYLVDYVSTGGWGRHLVREEHLELVVVKPQPPARRKSEPTIGGKRLASDPLASDPLAMRCPHCGAEMGQPCIGPHGITHAARGRRWATRRPKRQAAEVSKAEVSA